MQTYARIETRTVATVATYLSLNFYIVNGTLSIRSSLPKTEGNAAILYIAKMGRAAYSDGWGSLVDIKCHKLLAL